MRVSPWLPLDGGISVACRSTPLIGWEPQGHESCADHPRCRDLPTCLTTHRSNMDMAHEVNGAGVAKDRHGSRISFGGSWCGRPVKAIDIHPAVYRVAVLGALVRLRLCCPRPAPPAGAQQAGEAGGEEEPGSGHCLRPRGRPRTWLRSEERRVGKECRSRWSPY